MPTSSGRKGWKRLEHKRSVASQATLSAAIASSPYRRGRPRLFLKGGLFLRLSKRIAAFRCRPVVATNSFSISVFFFLEDRKYRSRTASAYSSMLRRATWPPFGNTIIDATIPLSVTIIMSQFVWLTSPNDSCTLIKLKKQDHRMEAEDEKEIQENIPASPDSGIQEHGEKAPKPYRELLALSRISAAVSGLRDLY